MSKVEMTVIVDNQFKQQTNADLEVQDYGSLCIFRGLNDTGFDWMEEHLEAEDWQHTLGGVAVDFRYTDELIELAVMDGLAVSSPIKWKLSHPWRFDEEVKRG